MENSVQLIEHATSQFTATCDGDLSTQQKEHLTDCLRTVRNLVAVSDEEMSLLFDSSWDFVVKVVQLFRKLVPVPGREAGEEDIVLCRCAIQFLGNFVNRFPQKQLPVWLLIRPHFAQASFIVPDKKINEYLSMLVFSCCRSCPAVIEDLCGEGGSEDLRDFVNSTASMIDVQPCSSSWALFAVQEWLKGPHFLAKFYPLKSLNGTKVLLDIIVTVLDDADQPWSTSASIAFENVLFISRRFIEDIQRCMADKEGGISASAMTEDDVIMMMSMLNILCLATAHDGGDSKCLVALQNTELIDVTLDVLMRVESLAISDDSNFAAVSQLAATQDPDISNSPFYGFKMNLLRLLGNLSYKSVENKRKLREKNAIPCILSCTNFDAKNPFATQWAVLALRHLCEDDAQNQQILAEMTPQGLADNEALLKQLGLKAELNDRGKLKVSYVGTY